MADDGTDQLVMSRLEDEMRDRDDDASTDGRTMRRRRNREAVIASLIALIDEGDLNPTVAKIADRAQVSHRSIFRYFDDLDDLASTAIRTAFREVWSTIVLSNPGEGSLEDRIDHLVSNQLQTVQRTRSLGRVARAKSIDIPEIDRGLATVVEFRRDQVRRHFALELDRMEPERAEAITCSIVVLMGFDGYDIQLRQLGHSDDEVAMIWTTTLRALLT